MLLTFIGILAAVLAVLACLGGSFWMLPVYFALDFLGLLILAFLFLIIAAYQVDITRERETDSPFYRWIIRLYVPALMKLVRIRLHTEGLEKTPKTGRFLLVCNHLFLADPAILLDQFPDSQLAFISKKENRNLFVVGPVMHAILCQPLDRENDRAALKTILKCIQLIKDDTVSIGVFPEGGTSRDGRLHPFRPGAFKIAQKTGVPIVVCTLQNTQNIFRNILKGGTDVHLHLVDVIPAEELKGKTSVEVADRVYEMMISDLGEEFRYIAPETEQNT